MSTDAKTLLSSGESSSIMRTKRNYLPGGAVAGFARRVKARRRRDCGPAPSLPKDVVHKILEAMVANRDGLSVIKLSMVNRDFRKAVQDDIAIWHQLYLFWRGSVGGRKTYNTGRGRVFLLPTYPLSLPNFRTKSPPVT